MTDNSEVEELNTKDASEADDQTMATPNFADIDDSGKSVEVALNNPTRTLSPAKLSEDRRPVLCAHIPGICF